MARDNVLTAAVDLARAAAVEVAESPDVVGNHLGTLAEGERLVTHRFESLAQGYPGWEWTVTLARVPRGRTATVSEVGLVATADAVTAPPWLPWTERLRPGDLGPTDVLPYAEHDDRLDQGYEATGGDADQVAIWELGLGRPRVLSRTGRAEAADRWYRGSRGPTAPGALASPQPCSTCGFLVLLNGALRTEFGVCANEWSPDDGKVVSMDHGCGAHSETDVRHRPTVWPTVGPAVDDLDVEVIAAALDADDETDDGETPPSSGTDGDGTPPAAGPGDGDLSPTSPATDENDDTPSTSSPNDDTGEGPAGQA